MIRTSLLERLGADRNAVLISSAHMKAGKSTLSVLLARSLAALGKKVLLVEADLYRPALAGRLGVEPHEGLAGVLNGTLREEDAIMKTGVNGFDILLAGALPAGFDHDRLAAGSLAPYLKRWKRAYDYVLLDGPPVMPVADARILASQADGVLMVLRASQSRRDEVVQAYADLSAAGGTLLGTVLVGAGTGRGYGGYGGYGAYDAYLTGYGDDRAQLEAKRS
jgi:capsular exopolysaccharide synthesis family protein